MEEQQAIKRCGCCRRPLGELEPFGKAGDPLVCDCNGAFLIKTWMEDWPRIEEAEIIYLVFWDRSENYEEVERKLIEEFGEEDAGFVIGSSRYAGQIGSILLCRDCIVLNYDDYFNKLFEAYGHDGLTIQGMRTLAKSLYEKCKKNYSALCSQIEEDMAKEKAAMIQYFNDLESRARVYSKG
jgi:hypothetical protein